MTGRTHRPGVRLLPSAVTVLALCAGLSAVYFAFAGRFDLSVAAVAAAALCDALDGRLARMLDATSRMGAELDSLSDLVSFGVAPALVLHLWVWPGNRLGWVVALVYVVCLALRLARFNTLLDAEDPYPFDKEFFVGIPAPAAALTVALPLYVELHFGPGWWSAPWVVALWALLAGGLAVSRLPTLAFKTVRVPSQLIAPLLVLVALTAAVLVTAPFLGLTVGALLYLALIPYAGYRYRWLTRHPEAWHVPVQQRRAVARAARSARRLGLRAPLRRRVAGRASAVARAVRRFGDDPSGLMQRAARPAPRPGEFQIDPRAGGGAGPTDGRAPHDRPRARTRMRLGLRRVRGR